MPRHEIEVEGTAGVALEVGELHVIGRDAVTDDGGLGEDVLHRAVVLHLHLGQPVGEGPHRGVVLQLHGLGHRSPVTA